MPFFLLPFPIVDPVAVNLGPLPIRWYALAYIGGFILGWIGLRLLVAREALWAPDQRRPTREGIDDLLVNAALGVIIGGRLGHVLFYDHAFYLSHPLEILQTWKGGMAFHGGLLGAVAGMWLFARSRDVPFMTVTDICAAVAPIGLFFGRLANFIKPEMWGRPTDVPWAMIFPLAGGEPRHPSQLYEAGLEGVALFLLLYLAVRSGALKRPGLVTGLFGVGYGLARIFCEFFREPDPVQEAFPGGLTMGMVLSLPLLFIGAALIFLSLRRRSALA
ncbi:prolipoprotein diacylglyceryl transferase [Methylocystis parvus]|uniref:Phosphatidylglycerol--prolipoprotein diacylglyceryl transferase n=1 Tax=Methylocystis parvus TaxID=134 RepID=A0A6B8M229_9HYPH|nr:prolipoprotein diacylglyceryl transferase [Methylocystis parvus]QGM97864.1 prolipoprotein diacylglyceryl transferase [Methylocystis parvus]WBK01827.1 prolipoprotein diacylglyceryl transferase [Methylocystis parvus OBBP]